MLWNDRIYKGLDSAIQTRVQDTHFNVLRKFLICVWRRKVTLSLLRYLKSEWTTTFNSYMQGHREMDNGFLNEVDGGCECLNYAALADWWNWKGGSRLFFWCWIPSFQLAALEWFKVYWIPSKQPCSKQLQLPVKDPQVKQLMIEKLTKVRRQKYI